jgi:Holliday junction DNA helicase RuvA
MIYSVSGKILMKGDHFAVVETGGLGLKLLMGERTLSSLPPSGEHVFLFTHFHVREESMDLFGFLSEDELLFFELLISVSGVGPKSALSILDVAHRDELSAAIKAGRPDLLTQASGIGRKTAERIIVELKAKVSIGRSGVVVEKMEADADLVEALSNLGYRRDDAREVLQSLDTTVVGVEDRLKAALKVLGKNTKGH